MGRARGRRARGRCEPLPPERKGGRRLGLAFLAILVVLAVLAGLAGRWAIQQVDPARAARRPGELHGQRGRHRRQRRRPACRRPGIITNARVFRWYVERKGGLELKPGYYALQPIDDMGNIVAALRTSPTQTFTKVTFPEGYAVARMGARLEKTVPRLDGGRLRRRGDRAVRSAASSRRASTTSRACSSPTRTRSAAARPRRRSSPASSQQMTRVADSVGIQKLPEPRRSYAVRGARSWPR